MTRRKSHDEPTSFADAMASLEDVAPLDRAKLANSSPSPPHPPAPGSDRSTPKTPRAKPAKPDFPTSAAKPASRAEQKRLRAGKIRPQASIDLHGYTRANAHRRLCNEIARARSAGLRCVLVIHGKGLHAGVGATTIKDSLSEWITQPPLVHQVSGCSLALPRDGGGGASYLLLDI